MVSMVDRLNILFMHSHNSGTFVAPYGHAVATPHLQRLAEEGVLFRKAFSTAPTCSPSRASFLTGMYPHSCGMLGLAHRGFSMVNYDWHAARVLKANGYFTATSGVEHTAPDLDSIGYNAVLSGLDTNYPDQPNRMDPADAVVDFLSDVPDQPFFINLGLNETHRPFHKAEPETYPAERAQFCIPPHPLPDTPETRADTADFRASARIMDDAFGKVLNALDENGLRENTLVFCFADHGLQFPRNMCTLTDHGLGVYCVVRGPGGFEGGIEVNALVSLMDLLPTAYEVAGILQPDHVEGVSLVGLVEEEGETVHDAIFGEVSYHAAYEPMRCVRTERYKYIRRYDNREKLVLPNVDDTPTKAFLLDQDWEVQPREQEMLFDLVFDPDEAHNIIDRADAADVVADLSGRLDAWMTSTNDPLLPNGSVPAPRGSRVNDSDGRSPNEVPNVMD
ncbi:MAG: sulfatase [Candidatus Latescibacteria bacterium]|nr:sulfatase [Candidatus Latescibacterota bacterium]